MKTIQITIDEPLLAMLDADSEVGRRGRSAVLRRAATEYLERRKREAVAQQYKVAYGTGHSVAGELAGWEDEGVWPDK